MINQPKITKQTRMWFEISSIFSYKSHTTKFAINTVSKHSPRALLGSRSGLGSIIRWGPGKRWGRLLIEYDIYIHINMHINIHLYNQQTYTFIYILHRYEYLSAMYQQSINVYKICKVEYDVHMYVYITSTNICIYIYIYIYLC